MPVSGYACVPVKLFTKTGTGQRLISSIHPELLKLNQKSKAKQAKNFNRHSSKEDVQMATKHVK